MKFETLYDHITGEPCRQRLMLSQREKQTILSASRILEKMRTLFEELLGEDEAAEDVDVTDWVYASSYLSAALNDDSELKHPIGCDFPDYLKEDENAE